jgi:FSR family fosmidomycin resistance protein-like MFS transporter
MTIAADAIQARTDVKILSLVSAGHFVSHCYYFTLPTLFIFLNQDLGFSYTMLGLLLTARAFFTGVVQVPAGFLIDRYGAKLMLIVGMMVMVAGYALMALATDYWVIMLLVVLGGIGDSVFHPADYSIINGSVSESRIGRAFSIHTFAGHLGFTAAPPVVAYLATAYGWRSALLALAVFGAAVGAVIISQWASLKDDALTPKAKKAGATQEAGGGFLDHVKMLASRPIMILFTFFVMSTLAGNAVSGFSIPALNGMTGMSAVDAGFAVAAFTFTSAFSVLAGGWIADRVKRQDLVAAIGYAISAMAILLIALVPMNYFLMALTFGFAGIWHGIIRPSRDMMVRQVTPAGSTGKVFGFIFAGQSFGGAIAPIVLGAILDNFPPVWIFYTNVVFTLLCVVAVLIPKGRVAMPAQAAE